MRIVAWMIAAGTTFVAGGFGIPTGFALGLSAWEVYAASVIGGLAGLLTFLYVGDRVRRRLLGSNDRDVGSGIGRIVERHGAKGLGLVGPVFPGVTASVVLGLTLRLERSAIARWMSIGVALMYGLYTVGMWVLIELGGVD